MVGALALGSAITTRSRRSNAAAIETRFDFTQPLEGWEVVAGRWGIEDVPDALGGKALVQRATGNAFNVIVAPGGPYGSLDVTVRFKPISGQEDASGGVVFRFADGRYYVIRANALEDNFNLYYYDRGRREITGVRVKAPALGQWHALRVSAEGDRLQGWLDNQHLLDHRDNRFSNGRVGLWTKSDSITAFDGLVARDLSR
jgi:hypothetical protein